MSKDPAFLFYSQDFYAGTRDMLPEERACYIDLLIYQHQRGVIPKDLKRLAMFCSGVDEGTLIGTLKAKFKETEEGWVNERLKKVMEERSEYKEKTSEGGKFGALMKAAYEKIGRLNKGKIQSFKDLVYNNIGREAIIEQLKNPEATLEGTLEGLLKHLENEIEIEDENKKSIEERKAEFAKKLEPYVEKYGKEMIRDFYNYWTESNEGASKFRKEMQKVFDIPKRLVTWQKNNTKFQSRAEMNDRVPNKKRL